jgi:UDP-glucose 4-epimerase
VTDTRAHEPRTVFVTGAAGFIGSALCHRLGELGYQVVAYDNLSRGRREYLPPGTRLVEGDIRDVARLTEAISEAQPDTLIHLAAMHFIPECIAHPQETIEVNVEGTRRVLDACRSGALGRVVVASSAAVYAPTDGPCDEKSTPLGPLEVYGESKIEAERLARAFHDESGVATTVLRLFNAIGRNETNPHVVPHIFESLQLSDVIELGNIAPRRDYIDTRDIAQAIVAIMRSDAGFRIFNVGTGAAYSVDDVIGALRRILGRSIAIVQDPARLRASERMLLLADIGRIREATGWAPAIPLEDTLKDLIAQYRLK